MILKMFLGVVLLFCANVVRSENILDNVGSGTKGNLRLCVVESRGTYKRASKFCPILDNEDSGLECVLGTDRLDCLRRMAKGTVDFGVFNPEDLVAAEWAGLDVLVTDELRHRPRPFEKSVVALVNRIVLPDITTSVTAILENRTLCHPGHTEDDRHPMSDTLSEYLESLVVEKSCNISMSLAENRIKALADFFGRGCIAGPWIADTIRDAELKYHYYSLCAACGNPRCATEDRYWGPTGALLCMSESVGDFTWAVLDDVIAYYGLNPGTKAYGDSSQFAYLCRDGTWQRLENNTEPCVWLNRPWPVMVAKRKAAASVTGLAFSMRNGSSNVENSWRGALSALLEMNQVLPEPLQPQQTPLDYLANARGFREAYSQSGCIPPRHITVCTKSSLERHKCEWLSEAGTVFGVAPGIQCVMRSNTEDCMMAVMKEESDVTVADSDWLVVGLRNFSLVPILHEATNIVQNMHTVVAYTRIDSGISNVADLRGKKVAFPRYDGLAWHSVLRHISHEQKIPYNRLLKDYFSEICAPGIEKYDVHKSIIDKFTKNCYKDGEKVLDGEIEALHSLIDKRSDVIFISIYTYKLYKDHQLEPAWANDIIELEPVCPDANKQYCFINWSNIGHVYGKANLTTMRRQEIVNVFFKLDQLFGKNYPFHNAMFSMYGPFDHQSDVIFHNRTNNLATDSMFDMHPYEKFPFPFENDLINIMNDTCQLADLTHSGSTNLLATVLTFISLVLYFIIS